MRDKFNKQLNTTLGQLSKAYELRSFTRNDIKEVQKKDWILAAFALETKTQNIKQKKINL